MKAELRDLTDETLDDALTVIADRFDDEAVVQTRQVMANPLRREFAAAGDVAYEDGKPVGVQAAILRRLYLGQRPLFGVVGGLLAMEEKSSPVSLLGLMRKTVAPRYGSEIFFANTSIPVSMKMNRMLGVKGMGPESCGRFRFAVTWWPKFLRWMLPNAQSRQLTEFSPALFGEFWSAYLTHNRGLVASRTPEELDWMFGARLKTGECVMFGEFEEERLLGYLIIKPTHGGRRWMVADMIALEDDADVMTRLVKSAVRYARKAGGTFFLECVGFPAFAARAIARGLTWGRKAPNNSFIYKADFEIPERSWFFGPYDGDRCMV